MQSNSTQIARAIAQLSVLTGSFDARGGNVLFVSAPLGNIGGNELLPAEQRRKALGLQERPLGPARWGFVSSEDVYRAILSRQPYGVHGMIGLGANLLLAHADSNRGREALRALDFYVHADLFMNPTAELADIVLPVASSFEREALKMGFEISPEAQSWVQFRQRVVAPQGEARSDAEILFDLAVRLGLGEHFWNGEIEAGYREQLRPSGVTLDDLREHPGGIGLPLQTRYRKYAELENGIPRGFKTPTRKIELYSETMLEHGYPPLPEFEEPMMSPVLAPGPGRSLSFDPNLRQEYALLRDTTPRHPEPAATGHGPGGGAASRHCRRARHPCRRLGMDRDPPRQSPGAGADERLPESAGRLWPAWLVAGLSGDRRSGL